MRKRTVQTCKLTLASFVTAGLLLTTGCNDSSALYGTLSPALINTNEEVPGGPFPGCVAGTALDTSRIQITFAFPPNATKMNVYRNGIMIGSSTSTALTSLVDENLSEGHTYLYTCEALVNSQYKMGTEAISVSTLSVNAPTFQGISTASAGGSSSATVTWLPADSKNGVAPAYYNVYYNLAYSVNGVTQSKVNWTLPPKVRISASKFRATIDGLGDELTYYFGVRACSESDVCDINEKEKSVTLPDGGHPTTPGLTAVAMVNGKASLTVPWEPTNGAVAKRKVYQSTSGGTDLSNYILVQTVAVPAPYASPDTTILVGGLIEKSTYYFIVRDEDPSGNTNTNTNVKSLATGDMSPPVFGGITTLVSVAPKESSLNASWTAIDYEDALHPNGAKQYLIYTTQAPYPYDLANGLLTPTIIPDPCESTAPVAAVAASGYVAGAPMSFPLPGLTPRTSYWVCVKAQDLAGNISRTTNYLAGITQDTTPPLFDGLQTIAFNNPLQRVDLTWNISPATDLEKYRLTLWKTRAGSSSSTVPVSIDVPATNASNISSYSFTSSEFSFEDGDIVYAQVVACDNAETLPGATQNCSSPTAAKSVTIPHIHPPKGFLGISGLTSSSEGVLTVSWYPPAPEGVNSDTGTWVNYAGFRIYHVQNSSLVFMKDCTCPEGRCTNNPTPPLAPFTSCTVTGDVHRKYTIYVAAYDDYGNYTTSIPSLAPGPSTQATAWTMDATAPDFSSNTVQDTVTDSSRFKLSWATAGDNQYPLEPLNTVGYRVYRKTSAFTTAQPWTSTLPNTPKLDADATLVSGPDLLSVTRFSEPYKIGGVPNLLEGSTYHWVVCAFDASGNSTCNPNVQSYAVTDRTPPQVASFNHTSPMPHWQLSWNMKDNVSLPPNIKAVIRLRKSTVSDTDFPAPAPQPLSGDDIVILNNLGSDATGTGANANFSASNPADPTTNIHTLANQQGDPGKTYYFNYAITVFDQQNNPSTPLFTSVRSKLAPPLKATGLTWSGNLLTNLPTAQADWTISADPDYASQQLVPWFSTNAETRCSGIQGAAIPLDAAAVTKAVPLSGGDGYYSFQIITTDTFGNTAAECSSNVIQLDRLAPTVTDVQVLGVGTVAPNNERTYTTGNSFFLQMTFNKPVLVTGSPNLQLAIPGAGVSAYFPGGGGAVASGNPSATILFQYNVGASDSVAHLQYASSNALVLNGGDAINDQAGNAWDFNLPAATAVTLSALQNVVIDTSTPSIVITSPTTAATPDYVNLDDAPPSYTISGTCSGGVDIAISRGGFHQLNTTCSGGTWSATISLAGLVAGPHPIAAKITNLVGKNTTDTIVLNAGTPSVIVAASGNNQQNVTAGNPVLSPFVALVKDSFGIAVPNVVVNWSIDTGITPNDANLAAPLASTTNSLGKATSGGFTTSRTAGANAVKATISGKSISTTFNVTTNPGAPAKLVFTPQPGPSYTAGQSFPLTVQVRDANENAITSNAPNITLQIQTNPSGGTLTGGGTISPNSAGNSIFNISINKIGVGYTLKASAPPTSGIPAITSDAFTIAAGLPAKLTFSTPPPSGPTAGAIFPDVVVQIQDAFGNNVTTATDSISLSYAPTGAPGGGTLLGSTNATAGLASFSGIHLDYTAPAPYTSFTFTANAPSITDPETGLGAIKTAIVTVQPGTPTQLVFAQSIIGSFGAGATLPSVIVQLLDDYGNLATSATNGISLALKMAGTPPLANPSNGATLTGGGSAAPSAGEATFSALSVNKANPQPYALMATALVNGVTISGYSDPFTIQAGAPDHISIVATTLTAGSPPYISADSPSFNVTVQIQDAGNNVITTEEGAVMALQMNNAGGTTVWSVGSQTSYSSGDFVFTGVSNTKSGTYNLVASTTLPGSGAMSSSAFTFKINAGVPKKLSFAQNPPNPLGATAPFAPIVEVRDINDNPVLTATTSVTMAISQNPSSGTLSGSKTVSANGTTGTATFNGLSIDRAGAGYQLQASATGLTSATSSTFDVQAGAASKLVFTSQPATGANIVAALNNLSATVEITDAGGNRVSTGAAASHSINLYSKDPASGDLSLITSVSASAGVATFSPVSLTTAKDGFRLVAIDGTNGAIQQAETTAFNIKPASPVELVLTPPSNANELSSGVCFANNPFVLTLKDTYGNATTWQSSTINIPLSITSTNGTGSAVFYSNATCTTELSKPATNYVAQFTNGATSSTFYVKYNSTGAPASGEVFKITADGNQGAGLTTEESPLYTAVRRIVFYYKLATTTPFNPIDQTFTVPGAGAVNLDIKAWGAGGGSSFARNSATGRGGGGAFVRATISTTGGETLTIKVPRGGQSTASTDPGGWGGSYSGVFRGTTPLLVAGGGGGGGNYFNSANHGGAAGGVSSNGTSAAQAGSGPGGGGGGTQAAGGAAADGSAARAGSYLAGGSSGTPAYGGGGSAPGFGGGGGAGYYGGALGILSGTAGGAGGGGSSYFTGTWTESASGSGTSPGGTGDADYIRFGSSSPGSFYSVGAGSTNSKDAQGSTTRGGDGMIVIYY